MMRVKTLDIITRRRLIRNGIRTHKNVLFVTTKMADVLNDSFYPR